MKQSISGSSLLFGIILALYLTGFNKFLWPSIESWLYGSFFPAWIINLIILAIPTILALFAYYHHKKTVELVSKSTEQNIIVALILILFFASLPFATSLGASFIENRF